jgi:membrane protease YdiL (CAAX protease family)
MNFKSLIQRLQLPLYFLLAYDITWFGILFVLVASGFQLAALPTQTVLLIFLLMILGPSSSSLFLTALLSGRDGFRQLCQGEQRWRIEPRWAAIALFTVPLLVLAILLALRLVASAAFTPGFQVVGLFIGLIAGILEELGWTGFATPRLLEKYFPLKAGLLLGLIWSFWHMLADFSSNISTMKAGWVVWFVVFWILPLTAYRILMTWVYSHTRSLLWAQLMHASYTGWLFTLSPAASFNQNLLWQILFAGGLWILVIMLVRPTATRSKTNLTG